MLKIAATYFLALFFVSGFSAGAFDASPIRRDLAGLHLGSTINSIQSVYPPKKEWPAQKEPKTGLVRIEAQRAYAKAFPPNAAILRLWMRWGRLVRLQLIYEREYSRSKPLRTAVTEYSLIYGEPRRSGQSYFWRDSSTVLQISEAEILATGGKGTELRTSLEVMDRRVFRPRD